MTREQIEIEAIKECHEKLDLITIGKYAISIHDRSFSILYYPDKRLPVHIFTISPLAGAIWFSKADLTKPSIGFCLWPRLNKATITTNALLYLVMCELGFANYKNYKNIRRNPVAYIKKYCNAGDKQRIQQRAFEIGKIIDP